MKIIKHNLNSLREIIRKLEEENKKLKQELKKHNIVFEDANNQAQQYTFFASR